MGDVVTFKKPKLSEKHANKALCRSGFHRWRADAGKPFDVKIGKLVTVYRCERCGATRNTLT